MFSKKQSKLQSIFITIIIVLFTININNIVSSERNTKSPKLIEPPSSINDEDSIAEESTTDNIYYNNNKNDYYYQKQSKNNYNDIETNIIPKDNEDRRKMVNKDDDDYYINNNNNNNNNNKQQQNKRGYNKNFKNPNTKTRDKSRDKYHKQVSLDKTIVRVLNEYKRMDPYQFETRLQNIAVPRKVGSSGHRKVRKFIENTLHGMSKSWTIREDRFWVGSRDQNGVRFRNIVATYEPSLCHAERLINPDVRRIVLACHYDSLSSRFVQSDHKRRRQARQYRNKFIGAIDAAVPCTILLELAQVLTAKLQKYHSKVTSKQSRLTLQLVFFDGEESLENNNNNNNMYRNKRYGNNPMIDNESLYGSKHLAKLWDRYNSTKSFKSFNNTAEFGQLCGITSGATVNDTRHHVTNIDYHYRRLQNSLYRNENIVLFILLDLIGIRGTKFYNTNLATTGEFFQLASIEKRLLKHTNFTVNMMQHLPSKQFQTNPPVLLSLIKDDHRPFMIRGIPTMALIPHPFPSVWHRLTDNMDSLDFRAIQRFKTILTIYIYNKFRNVL